MKGLTLAADPGNNRHKKPGDLGPGPFTTISVAVTTRDHDWLDRYAKYLNALVWAEYEAAGGEPGKGEAAHSRKSVAADGLQSFVENLRDQVKQITEKLGELPPADDREAVKKYAKKAFDLSKSKRS